MLVAVDKKARPVKRFSVIRSTIGMGVEKEDRKRTWLADAEVGITAGYLSFGPI